MVTEILKNLFNQGNTSITDEIQEQVAEVANINELSSVIANEDVIASSSEEVIAEFTSPTSLEEVDNDKIPQLLKELKSIADSAQGLDFELVETKRKLVDIINKYSK